VGSFIPVDLQKKEFLAKTLAKTHHTIEVGVEGAGGENGKGLVREYDLALIEIGAGILYLLYGRFVEKSRAAEE